MPHQVEYSNVEAAVVEVLVEEFKVPAKLVSPDKYIATDLQLDGDDAWEFLEILEGKFEIDLLCLHHKHFWPDTGLVKSAEVRPLTVAELSRKIHSAVLKA